MAEDSFAYDVAFQARMVRTLFQDGDFAQSVTGLLDPKLFEKRTHKWFAQEVLSYAKAHHHGISSSALEINAERAFKAGRLVRSRDTKAVKAFQAKLDRKVSDRSYVKEEVYRFIKNQITKETILNSVEYLKAGDFDSIDREFRRVVEIQMAPEGGAGGFLVAHSEQRMKRRLEWVKNGVQTGIAIDKYMKPGGLPPQQLGSIIAPPAAGKCLAPNTRIRKLNGSVVRAKDVKPGDRLLGPDNKPRTVLGVATGRAKMYRVRPKAATSGDGFECNGAHILTINDGLSGVVDVPLHDYLQWPECRKSKAKLVRTSGALFTGPLAQESLPISVSPWLLGLWYSEGGGVHRDTHGFRAYAHKLYLDGSRLPVEIMRGPWKQRVDFLAGWVDSGSYGEGGSYNVVLVKCKRWAKDLVDLARSIGLRACYKTEEPGECWRVSVVGDFYEETSPAPGPEALPVSHPQDAFTVEALCRGAYAGFTLDGDGRFLLADYTVTHNSNTLIHIGKSAIMLSQQPVLHFSFELAQHVIEDRYDSAFTGIKLNSLEDRGNPKKVHRFMQKLGEDLQGEPLVVQDYPAGAMTVLDLANKVRQLESKAFYPGMIIADAAYLMKPIEGYTGSKYEDIGRVYIELRALAWQLNIPIWTAGQGNKESLGKEVVTMRELADSFQQAMHADVLLALCQTDAEKDRKRARFFMMKNRNGVAEFEVPVRLDWSAPRIIPR